jgi:CRP-like cAMP-binding protein
VSISEPRHKVVPGRSATFCAAAVLEPPGVDRCPLFQGLAPSERAAVQAASTLRLFESRELIVRQGEPARALYLLASGRAKQTEARHAAAESIVRLLGPGDLCGWPCALTEDPSPATVRALEPTTALVWSRSAFEAFFRRLPALSRNALRVLAGRLREEEERYHQLASERVPRRLARTLLRLVRPGGRRRGDRLLMEVPLSRAELAQLTGTTLFTVSRVVSQWEERGVLEAHRGSVTVTDVTALEAIVAGTADTPVA